MEVDAAIQHEHAVNLISTQVARKAALDASYKPKKRKRRGGDWLPSPTASFDNEATASLDAEGDEDEEAEEADEEAVDLLVGLKSS